MKFFNFFLFTLLFLIVSTCFSNSQSDNLVKPSNHSFFIENKGQWSDEVKFLSRLPGCDVWITNVNIIFDYYRIVTKENNNWQSSLFCDKKYFKKANNEIKQKENHKDLKYNHQIVSMNFENSNFMNSLDDHSFDKLLKSDSYYNYFIGNDSAKWASNVGLFNEIKIKSIYNGINLRLYFENDNLRYDFIVKPGGDITQIQYDMQGCQNLIVFNNKIKYLTINGMVEHSDIKCYQMKSGQIETINSKFILNQSRISFSVGDYDKTKDLVIDPFVFSTFLAGIGHDEPSSSITHDDSGNVYITGNSDSPDFPRTTNISFGFKEVPVYTILTVLDKDGSKLKYSTFWGADSSATYGNKIKLYKNQIYLFGTTNSVKLPVTPDAFMKKIYPDNFSDIYFPFITIFDISSKNLLYSTYCGNWGCNDSYIDKNGFIYILGSADSSTIKDFNITDSTTQMKYIGGMADILVYKFDPKISKVVDWCIFGGSNNDVGDRFDLDSNNNVYIIGKTFSKDFPTTKDAYQEIWDSTDTTPSGVTFITKYDSNLQKIVFSTFFLYSSSKVRLIKTDIDCNIYFSGETDDPKFTTTLGAINSAPQNLYYHPDLIFVTKLNTDGSAILKSTCIGSSVINDYNNQAVVYDMSLDSLNNVYLIGNTWCPNYPITKDAVQIKYAGTDLDFGSFGDAIICKLSPNLNKLLYCSYLGGSSFEQGTAIDIDQYNNIYVMGLTNSKLDFPTTDNAFQRYGNILSHWQNDDVFIAKISTVTDVKDDNQNQDLTFDIYTNPSAERLFIRQRDGLLGEYSVQIVNLCGQSVFTGKFESSNSILNVDNFPSGVYGIIIKSENKVYRRLISIYH